MASAALAPEPPPKDAVTGLLSKFTRSPSRKHRPRPSSESIDSITPIAASKPTRVRPRPGPHRTTTAPDAPVTLSGIKELPQMTGDVKERTPVEGSMDIAGFALADAVRQPTFKAVKKKEKEKDEVPDVPTLNAQQSHNISVAMAQMGIQNNPNTLFRHIHDMSNKRIATLDYMRKA